MNFFVYLCSYVTILKGVSFQSTDDIALTAITDIPYLHLHQLYSQEVNGNQPKQWKSIKTNSDLSHRLRICEQVNRSGVFQRYGKTFVDMTDQDRLVDELKQTNVDTTKDQDRLHVQRKRAQYEQIYSDLFTDGKLTNQYRPRKFNISTAKVYPRQPNSNKREVFVEDYVFICLLREEIFSEIIPIYITKSYKADSDYHAHRFLLEERNGYLGIMLVEAPAEIYAPPDFSIEVYYRELKKNYPKAVTASVHHHDPIIRLARSGQLYHLCVLVLSSSHFKGKGVAYVRRLAGWLSGVEEISFKTKKDGEETIYSELLTPCYVRMTDGRHDIFYLSRAYKDKQVLVSIEDPSDKKIYLESLCINIDLLEDSSIFDDVHT